MSVCMNPNKCSLLVAPFLDLLVYLPFMQPTKVSKSVKFRALSTPSFTSLLILWIEIYPNLRCHKKEGSSFIIHLLVPIIILNEL